MLLIWTSCWFYIMNLLVFYAFLLLGCSCVFATAILFLLVLWVCLLNIDSRLIYLDPRKWNQPLTSFSSPLLNCKGLLSNDEPTKLPSTVQLWSHLVQNCLCGWAVILQNLEQSLFFCASYLKPLIWGVEPRSFCIQKSELYHWAALAASSHGAINGLVLREAAKVSA